MQPYISLSFGIPLSKLCKKEQDIFLANIYGSGWFVDCIEGYEEEPDYNYLVIENENIENDLKHYDLSYLISFKRQVNLEEETKKELEDLAPGILDKLYWFVYVQEM